MQLLQVIQAFFTIGAKAEDLSGRSATRTASSGSDGFARELARRQVPGDGSSLDAGSSSGDTGGDEWNGGVAAGSPGLQTFQETALQMARTAMFGGELSGLAGADGGAGVIGTAVGQESFPPVSEPERLLDPTATLSEIVPSPTSAAWPPKAYGPSGAVGPGIASTEEAVANALRLKFEQYTNPAAHGVSLNAEGRMFLEAVRRGHVPETVEGLGTLLAWLGMGRVDPSNPRPGPITAFFDEWRQMPAARDGYPG